mmetsp:Transcript_42203/g.105122  ORF Transcript_42203/g.105122 Transcript_42203/m.105122 type:complete len:437 (+) Transcript_42203:303-1613(+)
MASSIACKDNAIDPQALQTIETLMESPLCVAVGECGLDYDRMFSPRDAQLAAFDAQLRIAAKLAAPVFCHIRESSSGPALGAYEDAVELIRRHPSLPPSRVCVHCFTGDGADLQLLVDAGVCIGVTGFIGISRRCAATTAALRQHGNALLQAGRLLLETDAPFMLPDAKYLPPFMVDTGTPPGSKGRGRGRKNEPAVLAGVCSALAESLGQEYRAVAEGTTRAALHLFGLDTADASVESMSGTQPKPASDQMCAGRLATSVSNLSPPPLPSSLLARPTRALQGFEATWVAADWHESKPPRSFSGFFLPLIFSGLGTIEVFNPPVPAKHFANKPAATVDSIRRVQPMWQAVFSLWTKWVHAIQDAANAGLIDACLKRGVTGRASSLIPQRCPGLDQWSFGALPHLQPKAQNDIIEISLGEFEATRFYASVMALYPNP